MNHTLAHQPAVPQHSIRGSPIERSIETLSRFHTRTSGARGSKGPLCSRRGSHDHLASVNDKVSGGRALGHHRHEVAQRVVAVRRVHTDAAFDRHLHLCGLTVPSRVRGSTFSRRACVCLLWCVCDEQSAREQSGDSYARRKTSKLSSRSSSNACGAGCLMTAAMSSERPM